MSPITPVRFQDAPGFLLAGIRRWHPYTSIHASIASQWQEFQSHPLFLHSRPAASFGAICAHRNDALEYLSGVEVPSFDNLPPEAGRMRVPAQHYAVFLHDRAVSEVGQTWQSIYHAWLPTSGYVSSETPDFERYDEAYLDGGSSFEIWIGVRPVAPAAA